MGRPGKRGSGRGGYDPSNNSLTRSTVQKKKNRGISQPSTHVRHVRNFGWNFIVSWISTYRNPIHAIRRVIHPLLRGYISTVAWISPNFPRAEKQKWYRTPVTFYMRSLKKSTWVSTKVHFRKTVGLLKTENPTYATCLSKIVHCEALTRPNE